MGAGGAQFDFQKQTATWQPLAQAATCSSSHLAATWGKCLRVAASGCKWLLEHGAAKWLASGCKWLLWQVAASGCLSKWLQVAASGCKWLFEQVTIRLNEWAIFLCIGIGLKDIVDNVPPRCDRQSRPMRHRPCKNIPPEALPACENDQNYYTLTARSQFLQSKPIKKKVRLLLE